MGKFEAICGQKEGHTLVRMIAVFPLTLVGGMQRYAKLMILITG